MSPDALAGKPHELNRQLDRSAHQLFMASAHYLRRKSPPRFLFRAVQNSGASTQATSMQRRLPHPHATRKQGPSPLLRTCSWPS